MARKITRSWFWQDIRESLFAQPLKTGLTLMAVGIGMLALCLLLSILAGLQERARAQVAEIGADVAMITSGGGEGTAATPLDANWAERIRSLLPASPCAAVKHHELADIIPPGKLHVLSAEKDLPGIRGWKLEAGRWLDEADHAAGTSCAVISSGLAESQSLRIGDIFPIRETMVRVVGIMRGSGNLPGDAGREIGAHFLVVPPAMPAWWNTEPPGSMAFDAFFIKNRTYPSMDILADRLYRDMAAGAEKKPGWTLTTPDSLIASTRRMMQTVRIVYGSIAMLCLVLGGVTLSSLMMSNVQQRIAEIGLRMSIGASWRDIFVMFLCEGLVTTVAAGAGGIVAALIATMFIGDSTELPVHVSARVVLLPLAASLLLGLVFSWYPARAAANITPADALRND